MKNAADEEPYKYIEDLATADLAFEATGKTLEEAFSNAGKAVTDIITDIDAVEPKTERSAEIFSEDLVSLFFDWVDEILFYWDSERLVFSDFDVKIEKRECGYLLKASMKGEEFDMNKHKSGQHVKSPTYHLIKVENEGGLWKLRMIVDL